MITNSIRHPVENTCRQFRIYCNILVTERCPEPLPNRDSGHLAIYNFRLTAWMLQGIICPIQAARARGDGTKRNLITMAYLISGKGEYGLPT